MLQWVAFQRPSPHDLKKPMPSSEKGANYYRDFRWNFAKHSNEKERLKALLENWPPADTVGAFLDVGPGDGYISAHLTRTATSTCFVEPNLSFCRVLRKNFPEARVLCRRVEEAVFEARTFDTILCSHVLYYIAVRDWQDTFNKLLTRQGLRPGKRNAGSLWKFACLPRSEAPSC
jgi:SAM-dependent methyltransferase